MRKYPGLGHRDWLSPLKQGSISVTKPGKTILVLSKHREKLLGVYTSYPKILHKFHSNINIETVEGT